MDLPLRRRSLATSLALALAVVAVVSGSAATAPGNVNVAPARVAPQGAVLGQESATEATASLPATDPEPAATEEPDATSAPTAAPARAAMPERAAKAATTGDTAATPAKATSRPSGATNTSRPTYAGTNHVWIPALKINRSVASFPCDRAKAPDNLVYRWGCAGDNNVYLLGHAYSVFKPLHDAYVRHTLKVGMKAYYADAKGTVHTFEVRWWRITEPTAESHWAWDPQKVSSMTLQTCMGTNSEYRLIVRLVEVEP